MNIYRDALGVQDAVNLRAIARLLVQAADAAANAGGTAASYRDPAVVLIVNKIESLVCSNERIATGAWTECERLAQAGDLAAIGAALRAPEALAV